MQERIGKILRAQQLVAAGDRILVAVSGGADSVALLHLLSDLATDFPFDLMAAHLDHQLRPESSADALFVEELCRQLSVPVFIEKRDVGGLSEHLGTGLEDAGRQARRDFLERIAAENGCSAIALAHHADDQAETILFRLLRGSGLSGLAAMRMSAPPYIRPLLLLQRQELRSYLEKQSFEWREDASNEDQSFSRNRIRHQLLPLLEEYNPQIIDALNRLGRQAADEEEYWSSIASDFLEAHGGKSNDGYELSIEPLLELSRSERRRILRVFLRQEIEGLAGIESGHIDQVDALLESGRSQSDLALPGLWVGRRYGRLVCSKSKPELCEYLIEIPGPGEYELPTGARLVFSCGDDLDEDAESALFAAVPLAFPFTARSPRAGDRFKPSGMAGTKLLKDYFVDAKIDRESRLRTPVICHGDEIIWLAGRRRCEQFRPVQGEKLLKITLLRPKQRVE